MSIGKRNFWLDTILAVTFVIAIVSGLAMWGISLSGPTASFGGMMLHSWQHIHGLTVTFMLIGVIIHLLWHWKWVKAAFRSGTKPQQVKINRLLDGLMFVTFCLVMLSGLGNHGESHAAVSALTQINPVRVDPFHVLAGIGLLVIVLTHLGLHWKWLVTTARRSLG